MKKKVFIISVLGLIILLLVGSIIILGKNKDKDSLLNQFKTETKQPGPIISLKNFNIINVENINNKFKITFEEVKGATYYKIVIYDSTNKKCFEFETKETLNELEIMDLTNNEEYSLFVYAYNDLDSSAVVNTPYIFTWSQPSIDISSPITLNNQDYILKINGDLTNHQYEIKIVCEGEILTQEKIANNKYTVNKKYYNNESKELIVYLLKDGEEIDSINIFNKVNPITDLTLLTPQDNTIVPFNDLIISFSGGDNANKYIFNLYKDNELIQTKTNTISKQICVSKELLELGKKYRVDIIAEYNSYKKEISSTFTMDTKIQLNAVYISNDFNYLTQNSKITLKSSDANARIYYTLDGSEPNNKSLLYESPITISKNTTLKTIAIADEYTNSITQTYQINITKRQDLTVYLSPSNQIKNYGISSTGYTNECDEMNDVSNYIEERLKSYGVKIVRNKSNGNIKTWVKESNNASAALHLAIHSNASEKHDKYGIETWIDTMTSKSYSLASNIQENLMSIYPYNNLDKANRGVKYAYGALGEVNENNLNFGILIEVAHHDNKNDAEWIMKNKKEIGYNIADSILKYYQIIE